LFLDKNGTAEYRVLWLPSRFHQLYVYIVFYVVSKLIFTPWILWKVLGFVWRTALGLWARLRLRLTSTKSHAEHKYQV
jgi:hypothetical protein